MKCFTYSILTAMLIICQGALAQTESTAVETETTEGIRIELTNGVQRVSLGEGQGTLILNIRGSEIISMKRMLNGRTNKLTPARLGSSDQQPRGCECGHKCWEDKIAMQSICECKPCGGGGGNPPVSYLKIKMKKVNVTN